MKLPIPANDNWPLVLTRPEAAGMCRIGLSTFDAWVRKGILPRPIHSTRRWSRIAIEQALSGSAAPPDASSPFEQWRRARAH
jgi:predicted DNA-binding transcriptional regulator AlpA